MPRRHARCTALPELHTGVCLPILTACRLKQQMVEQDRQLSQVASLLGTSGGAGSVSLLQLSRLLSGVPPQRANG
jgi:hypothetical protein